MSRSILWAIYVSNSKEFILIYEAMIAKKEFDLLLAVK